MTRAQHPTWCSITRCGIRANGLHESEPVRVAAAKGRAPRFLASLTATRSGRTRVHMIIVGDMIINDVSVDLDTAQLLLVTLAALIEQTHPIG